MILLIVHYYFTEHLNTVGLVLDMIGVGLIAYSFKNIRREEHPIMKLPFIGQEAIADQDHKKLMMFDITGFCFLIVGLLLQIMSNYI